MSDPDCNYHFRRRWSGPPEKVESRPTGGTIGPAEREVSSSIDNVEYVFQKFKRLAKVAG